MSSSYDDIVCPQGNNWMEYFYQAFLQGSTVHESIIAAENGINYQEQNQYMISNVEFYKLNSVECYGDDSLCIDDVRGG